MSKATWILTIITKKFNDSLFKKNDVVGEVAVIFVYKESLLGTAVIKKKVFAILSL